MSVQLPLTHVDAKGLVWKLFSVEFDSPEGTFSTYLYAISWEHAQLQLDALRETGRVFGEICGVA